MIQAKGVYRLDALVRDDFIVFLDEMLDQGGWSNLLGVNKHLQKIVDDLDHGLLDIRTVCSSWDFFRKIFCKCKE